MREAPPARRPNDLRVLVKQSLQDNPRPAPWLKRRLLVQLLLQLPQIVDAQLRPPPVEAPKEVVGLPEKQTAERAVVHPRHRPLPLVVEPLRDDLGAYAHQRFVLQQHRLDHAVQALGHLEAHVAESALEREPKKLPLPVAEALSRLQTVLSPVEQHGPTQLDVDALGGPAQHRPARASAG